MKIQCLTTSLALLFAVASFGQSGALADPISGTWTGEPEGVVFELKFDGESTVTGMVTPQPGVLKVGTFDMKTGALKLEGDTIAPDGVPCRFIMEGKVENGVATGVATCGTVKVADFKIVRK